MLPHFRTGETYLNGADEWRGGDGPLKVSRSRYQHPITTKFIESAFAAGVPASDDFNGPGQEGVGYCQHTIAKGVRSSSANANIKPVRHRKNLTISAMSQIQRILVSGRVATDVAYEREGVPTRANARREVLLCAGAIGSPQILLLSGIGPGEDLRQLDIPVTTDLPE